MSPSGIKIVQWNCRSLPARLHDLIFILDEQNIDIAALCETHLDDSVRFSLPNFEVVSRDRNRRGGGVAVLVSNKYKFSVVRDPLLDRLAGENSIEMILVKVFTSHSDFFIIGSLYSPPRGTQLHRYSSVGAWEDVLGLCS